jgi:hypothetical protein
MSGQSAYLEYTELEKPVNTWGDICRRAALWTLLCCVSAGPSFIWASRDFDSAAMISGVAMFIVFYTVGTSTRAFLRFQRLPFVRRTLYIGYGLRVILSIVFPVGMTVDLLPGMFSVTVVQGLLPGISRNGYLATLLITIVQGTIINVLLSMFMGMVWAIQRVACKPPRDQSQGFPVEMKENE